MSSMYCILSYVNQLNTLTNISSKWGCYLLGVTRRYTYIYVIISVNLTSSTYKNCKIDSFDSFSILIIRLSLLKITLLLFFFFFFALIDLFFFLLTCVRNPEKTNLNVTTFASFIILIKDKCKMFFYSVCERK